MFGIKFKFDQISIIVLFAPKRATFSDRKNSVFEFKHFLNLYV